MVIEVANEFKGLLIFKNGLPVGFIRPGQENVGHLVHVLVECGAHGKPVSINPEGIGILHC